MFRRARLLGAVADLQHVLRGDGRIEMKFAASPGGGGPKRGVRREPMTLRRFSEVHGDRNVPARVDVNVTVPFDFENGQRQVDIDGRVRVDAVVNLIALAERLDALADEYEQSVLSFPHHFKPYQHLAERFPAGAWATLGFVPGPWR